MIDLRALEFSNSEISMLNNEYLCDNFISKSSLNRKDIKKYPELLLLLRAHINLKRLIKNLNYEKR